jgi:hypothetical protein
MNAAGIAHQLGATRQGDNWRAPCPLGCGYTLSLSNGENGRLLAHCFGGCEFDQVMAALVQYGLLDDDDGDLHVSRSVAVCQRDRSKQILEARAIYSDGIRDRRRSERIGAYFASREISLNPPILRINDYAPHRLGARLLAMVAPITNVDGEQTGVHLTYLSRENDGKADLPKQFQRETRGVIRGGAIRLMSFNPEVELILAEGIETALSAAEIFGLPAWSAVYAGGLKSLDLPPEVRRILIAADHDEAGRQCALAARDRWVAEGREVRVKVPPTNGRDFNDVLLGRRRNAAGT